MKKIKYIVYCKILYNMNKDVIILRKKLAEYSCKGVYITKKESENFGLKQYINTFLIHIDLYNNNLNNILTVLNKTDYLQILGVINDNNILVINYSYELKNNIIYNYKLIYNIFIIKKIILLPFKLILNKK